MAKYRANPVIVEAFKIVSASPLRANGSMDIATEDGVNREADAPMLSRYAPTIGDYWVIQEDGYEYVNPKAVFERKYSLVGD